MLGMAEPALITTRLNYVAYLTMQAGYIFGFFVESMKMTSYETVMMLCFLTFMLCHCLLYCIATNAMKASAREVEEEVQTGAVSAREAGIILTATRWAWFAAYTTAACGATTFLHYVAMFTLETQVEGMSPSVLGFASHVARFLAFLNSFSNGSCALVQSGYIGSDLRMHEMLNKVGEKFESRRMRDEAQQRLQNGTYDPGGWLVGE